jgi:hypothetical protein
MIRLPATCRSPQARLGREYALAVAVDATGSTRPVPVGERSEMIATKQPFAACGRLGLFG